MILEKLIKLLNPDEKSLAPKIKIFLEAGHLAYSEAWPFSGCFDDETDAASSEEPLKMFQQSYDNKNFLVSLDNDNEIVVAREIDNEFFASKGGIYMSLGKNPPIMKVVGLAEEANNEHGFELVGAGFYERSSIEGQTPFQYESGMGKFISSTTDQRGFFSKVDAPYALDPAEPSIMVKIVHDKNVKNYLLVFNDPDNVNNDFDVSFEVNQDDREARLFSSKKEIGDALSKSPELIDELLSFINTDFLYTNHSDHLITKASRMLNGKPMYPASIGSFIYGNPERVEGSLKKTLILTRESHLKLDELEKLELSGLIGGEARRPQINQDLLEISLTSARESHLTLDDLESLELSGLFGGKATRLDGTSISKKPSEHSEDNSWIARTSSSKKTDNSTKSL